LNQALGEVWRILRPAGKFYATAGGKGHLQELEYLLEPFLAEHLASQLGGREDRFGMENGEKLLAPFFENVRRCKYNDRLVFNHLTPVLDYVLSEQYVVWSMTLDQLESFVQRVKNSLDQNGKIRVTVRKGIFVARKKRLR
jgi:glycosylphosphatidylinositol transamidase (GPIT) subunit GPI8